MKQRLPGVVDRRTWCLTGVSLLIAGCATPARTLAPSADKNYWSGRMLVQVFDAPPLSTSGSFELSGSAQTGELVLLNPLGNIVARMVWNPAGASMVQANATRQADSLATLTHQLLGTPLPIAALFDWLQGTATAAPGWTPDVSALPQGKLSAHRHTPLPEASLKIVLDQ